MNIHPFCVALIAYLQCVPPVFAEAVFTCVRKYLDFLVFLRFNWNTLNIIDTMCALVVCLVHIMLSSEYAYNPRMSDTTFDIRIISLMFNHRSNILPFYSIGWKFEFFTLGNLFAFYQGNITSFCQFYK